MIHRIVETGVVVLTTLIILFGVHRWLSVNKELRKSAPMEARLLVYMDDTNTGLIEVREGNRIAEANRAACNIFGYSADSGMDGLSISAILPKWFAGHHDARMNAALDLARKGMIAPRVSTMRCTAIKQNGDAVEVIVRVFIGRECVLAIVNKAQDTIYFEMPPKDKELPDKK